MKKTTIKDMFPMCMANSPDTNMLTLMDILPNSEIIPDKDKYYVFLYKAKTKNITYDSNPLVYVTGVYQWGFTGMNYHWQQVRRYTWGETNSNLYEVDEKDMKLLLQMPLANFQQS